MSGSWEHIKNILTVGFLFWWLNWSDVCKCSFSHQCIVVQYTYHFGVILECLESTLGSCQWFLSNNINIGCMLNYFSLKIKSAKWM